MGKETGFFREKGLHLCTPFRKNTVFGRKKTVFGGFLRKFEEIGDKTQSCDILIFVPKNDKKRHKNQFIYLFWKVS